MQQHIDNRVELKLVVHKELDTDPKKDAIIVKKEWEPIEFAAKYENYFITVPFFNLLPGEFREACRAVDTWIRDRYKGSPQIIHDYINHSVLPDNIKEEFSDLYKEYWNVLTKENQNRQCLYQILDRPILGFENLDINIFSGFKVTGPFGTDRVNYYMVLTLLGKMKDIDRFHKTIFEKKDIIKNHKQKIA